jgi:Phage terminase large subunit (GpA)
MKAVMDALSPRHPAQRVVFLKAAQVGATVASNNWMVSARAARRGRSLPRSRLWIWPSACRNSGLTR